MKIVVVGAGIIGTTTAYRVKKQFPDSDLSIIAAQLSPHTTSDVAAGWWEPHLDPDTDPSLVVTWSRDTYQLLATLARGDQEQELGPELSCDMMSTVTRVTGHVTW